MTRRRFHPARPLTREPEMQTSENPLRLHPRSASLPLQWLATSAVFALVALLTACSDRGADASSGVQQTQFPGQVTAGGGTSGQVMASAPAGQADATASAASKQGGTPGIPAGSGGNTGGAVDMRAPAPGGGAGNEGARGQSGGQGVAGTPGIPEGSGGTTSGAAMGGTTSGAAGTEVAPPQKTPEGNQSKPSSDTERK